MELPHAMNGCLPARLCKARQSGVAHHSPASLHRSAHQGMHMVLEAGCVSRPARHSSQVALQRGQEEVERSSCGCRGAATSTAMHLLVSNTRKHVYRCRQPPSSRAHLVLLTERYVLPVHLVHRSLPGRVPTLLVG